MSRPSPNPDAPALKAADAEVCVVEGLYCIVADNGSRRSIHCYARGIAEARRVAAGLTGMFPAIYCRLEGKWRLVH